MYEEVIVEEGSNRKKRKLINVPCVDCGSNRLIRPKEADTRKRCQKCAAKKVGESRKSKTGLWIISNKSKHRAERIFCSECSKEIVVRVGRLAEHKGKCYDCNSKALGKARKGHIPWNKGNKTFDQKGYSRSRSNQIRWGMKKKVIKHMGDKCQICDRKNLPIATYECHHVDPKTKLHSLSQLLTKGWNVIEEEIKKCILVCKNCHAIIHYSDETL
jgi:hypothetical protein